MTITTEFLDSLDRFSLVVNKRVTSTFAGGRKSVFTGRGTIVSDHRMYTPGDDFRSIDWNIYARTDKLHIKDMKKRKSWQCIY